VDVVEDFRVGIPVTLLRARKVGSAATAAGTQSMAKRAIRTELKLAQLYHFRIAREGILLLSVESPRS